MKAFKRPPTAEVKEGDLTIPLISKELDRIMYDGYYKGIWDGSKDKPKPSQAEARPFQSRDAEDQYLFGKQKPNTAVIDVDCTGNEYEKIVAMLKDQGVCCAAIRGRSKGGHIYFMNDNKAAKGRQIGKKILLTASPVDILAGIKANGEPHKSACIGLCNDDGSYRKLDYFKVNDEGTFDPIPFWCNPIDGAEHYNAFGMADGDGRNDFLHNYMIVVKKAGYSYQEYIELVKLINQYIFDKPVSDEEFETATRKEEWDNIPESGGKKDVNISSFKDFIQSKGIVIRYNDLLNIIEYNNIPEEYRKANDLQNELPIYLQYGYRAYIGNKGVSKSQTIDLISVLADENTYNPLHDYLTNAQWDGVDRFPELFRLLQVQNEFEQILIRKWFYQTAALPFSTFAKPIQPEGVLILSGDEGIGKTRFFEKMACKSLWFQSLDKEFSTKNKDNVITMISAWISELGEIDRTFEANRSDLKNFMTMSKDTLRKPYAREPISKPRTTSFCGTTNKDEFLTRDTGYRRWWIVHIKARNKLDMSYFNAENLHQFWLQCYNTYINNPLCFRLSNEEQRELQERNKSELQMSPAEEILRLRLDFEADISKWNWTIAATLADKPEYWLEGAAKYTPEAIGKALKAIMADEPRIQKKRCAAGYKYLIPPVIHGVDRFGNTKTNP